jgi:pyroglutamyl-peptidase
MAKTILLTGFEPFAGANLNSSWEAVRTLHGQGIGNEHLIVSELLPCVFAESLRRMGQLLAAHQPEIVVAVGQAGGRPSFSLERVAINLQDAAIPDNQGDQPVDQSIQEDGPSAYFSTLPVKAIVAELRKHGIPAEVSHSAGTYVCNTVFYGLMHAVGVSQSPIRAGFVHVPYLPEQAAGKPGAASMALPAITEGLRLTLSVTLSAKQDLRFSAGTTH